VDGNAPRVNSWTITSRRFIRRTRCHVGFAARKSGSWPWQNIWRTGTSSRVPWTCPPLGTLWLARMEVWSGRGVGGVSRVIRSLVLTTTKSPTNLSQRLRSWKRCKSINVLTSDGRNLKDKVKASTLKAKAWTFEAKAFKCTATTEIKIHSTSDSLTG